MEIYFSEYQLLAPVIFFFAGLLFPAVPRKQSPGYWPMFIFLQGFALAWFAFVLTMWPVLPKTTMAAALSPTHQAIAMYATYSFVGYWWHRARHTSPWLWQYLHSQHHHPQHLDSLVALYRHPAELIADSVVLIGTACVLGVDWPAVLLAISVEFLLEIWHHSNLRWAPKNTFLRGWVRLVQRVLQTPEMHRVHHRRGYHTGNFATISIWDSLFGSFASTGNKSYSVGLDGAAKDYLLWRNAGTLNSRIEDANAKNTTETAPQRNGRSDVSAPARAASGDRREKTRAVD